MHGPRRGREWQCELIRDRYSREVLSAMSIADILALQSLNPPASYMSKVLPTGIVGHGDTWMDMKAML